MGKRIAAIVLLYLGLSVAWTVLGGSVELRTRHSDGELREEVAALWGTPQCQLSPELVFTWPENVVDVQEVEDASGKRLVTKQTVVWKQRPVILDGSEIDVALDLDQRRKGLLWYATYGVVFRGNYVYEHDEPTEGELILTYRFPSPQASYDDFRFEVAGVADPNVVPVESGGSKVVEQRVPVRAGTKVPFLLAYRTRGMEWWRYGFGPDVNRIRNFSLTMTTDFRDIDYPAGTISADGVDPEGEGLRLQWRSENLISGFQIGMEMPQRINPGPLAARISFFAPVCLGFFFVWIFLISMLEGVELHPMNYLFLGAAFFAFHLLFAYSVDHVDVKVAFVVCSIVSVFLVVSYLRLVVGMRFAAVEAGISQFVYLVLFSWAHFLEGFTGLIVTIGSILTLFALMQLTGRVRWAEVLRRPETGIDTARPLRGPS